MASPPLDLVANLDTLVGHVAVAAGFATAFAVFLWRRGGVSLWIVPTIFALVALIELALKLVLPHPGPPQTLTRSFIELPTLATPNSLPSGHVARVAFLSLLAAGIWPTAAVRIAAIALVVVTLWARVYIGDHWLSDGLGGLALGAGSGWIALRAIGRH